MSTKAKYNIKKIITTVVWTMLGVAAVYLQLAASEKRDAMLCKGVEIDIKGVNTHFFIDRNDVLGIVRKVAGGKVENKPVSKLDLSRIEKEIKKDIWIRDAQLFVDNNGMLVVEIDEREPIARIFTEGGTTYYIDSSLMMLPLSEKFSARVPVFTNFPSEAKVLHKRDSLLLNDIGGMSSYIQSDSFLMGMIDQVDINNYSFEFIPKIGNQVIVFGDGSNVEDKFSRLKLFYKNVMTTAGWDYYSHVNLSYNNQVVAKRRDAQDIVADSLRTMQLLKLIAERAERMAQDSALQAKAERESADSSIILQSLQRDEEATGQAIEIPAPVMTAPVKTVAVPRPVEKAASKPAIINKPVVAKNSPAKKVTTEKKTITVNKSKSNSNNKKPAPKVTMPSKQAAPSNDY